MNSIPDSLPSLDSVKHVVLVLSGKGGVGKSSVTTQLALTLVAKYNYNVGVLDIDLTGPSAPRMFGLEGRQVHQSTAGWIPVYVKLPSGSSLKDESIESPSNTPKKKTGSLAVMSLGFLLENRGDAVVWRGPKKTAMIRQLLTEMVWAKDLDYLLIDTPPGTSDEHISIAECLLQRTVSNNHASADGAPFRDGAVLVTTPQGVATADVRKELSFCRKVGFNVLGVIENMSGFMCPHCTDVHYIFGKDGGLNLAKQFDLKMLGSVPIDPRFVLMIEQQQQDNNNDDNGNEERNNEISTKEKKSDDTLVEKYSKESSLYPIFQDIVQKLISQFDDSPESPSVNQFQNGQNNQETETSLTSTSLEKDLSSVNIS